MKMKKLILAASLATIPVMSAFMESASAQRGMPPIALTNTYSQTNNNRQFVNSQFDLVNTTRDGNLITDAEIDPNIGFFRAAIQRFTTGSGEICVAFVQVQNNCLGGPQPIDRMTVDSFGFPLFNQPYVSNSIPFDGDLRAELIENGIVRYSIFQPGNPQAASTYRLDFSGFNLDRDQSINNLSYILQQDLLANAQPETRNFGSASGSIVENGRLFTQNRFEEDVPAKIFEPSATLGIFAVLSTASLLKRKTKKISAQ